MDKNKNLPSKYHVRYPEWLKRKICQEYLNGECTKKEIQKKYGIRGNGRLLYWLQEFGYIKAEQQTVHIHMSEEPDNQDTNALKQRIKELEAAVEEARIRAEGYQIMIEEAEKEFKIPIRKKSATKPSK